MPNPARILLALAAAGMPAATPAQTSPAYTFTVVSVKPHTTPERPGGLGFQPGGRFQAHNFPLIFVISLAYNVPFQSTRLTGGPDWLRSEGYDIDAVPDKDALPPGLPDNVRRDRQRAMLRALLADRFHLVVHTETKEIPVYAEVVNKGGLKLAKSTVDEKDCDESTMAPSASTCHAIMGGRGRGMHSNAADLSDLALAVSNYTDLPVVDETGVKGLFKIDTKPWVSLDAKPPAPGAKGEDGTDLADLSTVFTVFTEMGLKLERRKASLETYTIERVERPAAN